MPISVVNVCARGGVLKDQTIRDVFTSPQWASIAGAFFDATGLSVSVACDGDVCISRSSHCSVCGMSPEGRLVGEVSCVSEVVVDQLANDPTRVTCRGGLPCYAAALSETAHVSIGGFFSSTRERKRIFESLVGRGLAEDQARLVVRAVPILTHRQVESLAAMIRLQAGALVHQHASSDETGVRQRELEFSIDSVREFADEIQSLGNLAVRVLSRSIDAVDAVGGVLYLARAGALEAIVTQGETGGEDPQSWVATGDGIVGKVAAENRTVFVSAGSGLKGTGSDLSVMGVPLGRAGSENGVICLYLSAEGPALSGEALKRLESAARIGGSTLARADEMQRTHRRAAELEKLSEFGKSIGAAADISEIEPVVVEMLSESFDSSVAGLVLSGWNSDRAIFSVEEGVSQPDLARIVVEATGHDMTRTPFGAVRILGSCENALENDEPCQNEWSLLCAEIVARDKTAGYVFVASPGDGAYTVDDRRFLEGISQHAAVAFEKASVFDRMRVDYARVIAALSVTLDAGEHASRGHSDRVMDYAMLIGQEIGLPFEQVELLRFAGLMHDIGKVGISEEILLKPSKLTEEEMRRVQGHVRTGATLVEQVDFLNDLAPIIMHHHERWDGTGYPMGLRGEDIPLMARILGVADAYDAMTSDRPYRPRLSHSAARAEMEAGAGTQFDPRLVAALYESLDRKVLGGATGLLAEPYGHQDILPS